MPDVSTVELSADIRRILSTVRHRIRNLGFAYYILSVVMIRCLSQIKRVDENVTLIC
jgi:hypothetical protein